MNINFILTQFFSFNFARWRQTKRRKLFTPNTDQDYDDMDDAPESNEKAIAERGPIEEQIVDVSTQMKSFDIAGNRNPLGTLKANSITTRDSQASKLNRSNSLVFSI